MALESSSKWALVTGASSGLGAAIARALVSQDKFHVDGIMIVARREERLQALATEINVLARDANRTLVVEKVVADLSDAKDGIKAVLVATEKRKITLLVNCAGLAAGCANFDSMSTSVLNSELDVNVRAPLLLSRALIPRMLEHGEGMLLNISSIAAAVPAPFMASYGASKSWLYSWSVALSRELASTPVSVTCYCPGHLRTEFDAIADSHDRLLGKSSLLSESNLDKVARHALLCTLRRKRWATNGWVNWFNIMLSGITPLSIILLIAALLQRVPSCRV